MPTIPSIDAAGFAGRLLRLYPRGWLSGTAQQPGGNAYATTLGIGTPLARFMEQLAFINAGLRIKTAYGTALDTIALDYFGVNGLPRLAGESDNSYRARILQALLVPRVTRSAIQNTLKQLTGLTPRMAEPWSPGDSASYDVTSFYGVDGPENIAPSRYGDWIPWTGFIDVSAPVTSTSGGFPIYTLDAGSSYDTGFGAYDLAGMDAASSVDLSYFNSVIARALSFKAWGVTVGVRFSSNAALVPSVNGILAATAGSATLALDNSAMTLTLQSWLQEFGVWLEVPSWQASTWMSQRGVHFAFTASSTPSDAATLGWLAQNYLPGSPLALRVPVNQGQTSIWVTCAQPVLDSNGGIILDSNGNAVYDSGDIPAGTVPAVTADWDTEVYVKSFRAGTGGALELGLSAAGAGNLDIIFLPGYSAAVAASATSVTVSAKVPAGSYALFAIPSWVTAMSSSKSSGSFTLDFGTAVPSGGGTVYWAAMAN